jgi:hypothetical protein
MGRSEAEANARQAVEDNDREIPLGSAVLQRDRPESKHFLIRFPYQAVEDGGVEPGDELDQYYDYEAGELVIPLE